MYLILGWLAIGRSSSSSPFGRRAGLLATGGLLYTVGAVVLASGRPDPRLATRYHEIWHTFVVSASASHFALGDPARATVTAAGRDRVASVATSGCRRRGGRRRWRPGGEGGPSRRRRGRGRRRLRRRGGGAGPTAAGGDPGPVAAHRGQRRAGCALGWAAGAAGAGPAAVGTPPVRWRAPWGSAPQKVGGTAGGCGRRPRRCPPPATPPAAVAGGAVSLPG